MAGSKRLSPQQKAERVALAARLKGARFQTIVRLQHEVTQDDMAVLVGKALGRPLHATQWRRYESGKSEAPLGIIRAVALVSGLPECVIAFGPPDPNAGAITAGTAGQSPAPTGINWDRAPMVPVESVQPMPRPRRRQALKKRKGG